MESRDNRSIAQLIRDLLSQISDVTRKEMALARAEISDAMSGVKSGLAQALIGAILAIPGLTILLGAIAIGLSARMELWLAAILVGGVTLLLAGALLMIGLQNMKLSNLEPKRTERSIRADTKLIRERFQ
jgi:hypothetical protein